MAGGYNNNQKIKSKQRASKKKTANGVKKVPFLESEIKSQISQFIRRHKSGEGYRRLGGINELLQKCPKVKNILIKEIHDYVTKAYPLASKSKLYFKPKEFEKLLIAISLKDFTLKKYESYPFLLKKQDFYKMINCPKSHIVVKGFKTGPTYKFLNNFVNPVVGADENFTNNYIETQFFASSDRKIIFAKTVRQIFRINDTKKFLREFSKEAVEHDRSIAQRGFSVAMYSFLQGSEKKLSLFARLDDDGFNHRNLLIDERRKKVFGEVAGYPHFHFQNETDQYLCRKESDSGYKTGRCNAIDVPHLIKYLVSLENQTKQQIKSAYARRETLDLPFLDILVEREEFFPKPLKIVEDFVKNQGEEGVQMCKEFFADFDNNYNLQGILGGLDYFKNFAFTLLLLQHISDLYWSEENTNLKYKNFLAQFEITLSEKVMDAICNVSERTCRVKGNKHVTMRNDFDENYANFPAL